MRYYEPRYPEVDELVMVQVRQIAEMGAYVKLVCLSARLTMSVSADHSQPSSLNTTTSRA